MVHSGCEYGGRTDAAQHHSNPLTVWSAQGAAPSMQCEMELGSGRGTKQRGQPFVNRLGGSYSSFGVTVVWCHVQYGQRYVDPRSRQSSSAVVNNTTP